MLDQDDALVIKENIKQKVARRDHQANIMNQIIELAKQLTTSNYKLAEKIRYPDYLRKEDIEELRNDMDGEFWRDCLNELQVEKFLTTKDKEKLFDKLSEKCPVFNEANVNETLVSFMTSKDATATDMIKKIYHEVTDMVFRLGNNSRNENEKRLQLGIPKSFRATLFYGRNGLPHYISGYDKNFAFIDDLERACYLVDGKVQPDRQNCIRSQTDEALRVSKTQVDGAYFVLDFFKNGNVKLTFKNLEMLKTLNHWGQTGKYIA